MVGLDIEWRPNQTTDSQNPVATIQLCDGHRCLIIKLIHSPFIPQSLVNFLGNPNYTFVGVGIENDAKKLKEDYDLTVANTIDLRELAVQACDMKEFNKAGLKVLAKYFLDKDVEKPKRITMSGWDIKWLSSAQVQYACVDAFLSYKIGRILM